MSDKNDILKIIYAQIIRGRTEFSLDDSTYYIKHLSFLDSADIDSHKLKYFNRAKEQGLPTYSDRFNSIIENKTWSLEKDKETSNVKDFLENLKHSKTLLPLEKDRKIVDKQILEYKLRLNKLVNEKSNLIGLHCESWAEKKINEYYVFTTLYRDSELTQKLYSSEEFNDLEQFELDKLTRIYNEKMVAFVEGNLRRISLMPYFFNVFNLAGENIYYLFGKPLVNLTFYQIEIISNARNYKNILQNSKTSPPLECLSDSDKLLEWFEQVKTQEKLIESDIIEEGDDRKVVTAAKGMVGASKKELEMMGVDKGAQTKLEKALKESKTGEVGFEEILKLNL